MRLEWLKKIPFPDYAAPYHSGFLLSIGEGKVPQDEKCNVDQPDYVQISDYSTHLLDEVLPDISENYKDVDWMMFRAIISATGSASNALDDEIMSCIPGSCKILKSVDSVTTNDSE